MKTKFVGGNGQKGCNTTTSWQKVQETEKVCRRFSFERCLNHQKKEINLKRVGKMKMKMKVKSFWFYSYYLGYQKWISMDGGNPRWPFHLQQARGILSPRRRPRKESRVQRETLGLSLSLSTLLLPLLPLSHFHRGWYQGWLKVVGKLGIIYTHVAEA